MRLPSKERKHKIKDYSGDRIPFSGLNFLQILLKVKKPKIFTCLAKPYILEAGGSENEPEETRVVSNE